MASSSLAPSFAAINGLELKKIILKELERKLDADSRFAQHLAYARIEWRWVFASDSYPAEVGNIKLDLSGTILAPETDGKIRRKILDNEVPESVDLRGGSTVAAPMAGDSANEARRKAGLPVPTPRTVRGIAGSRMTVDSPDVPKPARESQEEDSSTPQVVTNKPTGKGVIARSATIRTRANRKGVEAPVIERTPQTAADAEKIIENGLADGTLAPVEDDGADSTND